MSPCWEACKSPHEPTLQGCVLSSILACPGDASGSPLPPFCRETNLWAMCSTCRPAAAPIPTQDSAALCDG